MEEWAKYYQDRLKLLERQMKAMNRTSKLFPWIIISVVGSAVLMILKLFNLVDVPFGIIIGCLISAFTFTVLAFEIGHNYYL